MRRSVDPIYSMCVQPSFIIGTNNDFVPQDVGESVYYLSDRMKKALDSLCFSPDEEEKQLL